MKKRITKFMLFNICCITMCLNVNAQETVTWILTSNGAPSGTTGSLSSGVWTSSTVGYSANSQTFTDGFSTTSTFGIIDHAGYIGTSQIAQRSSGYNSTSTTLYYASPTTIPNTSNYYQEYTIVADATHNLIISNISMILAGGGGGNVYAAVVYSPDVSNFPTNAYSLNNNKLISSTGGTTGLALGSKNVSGGGTNSSLNYTNANFSGGSNIIVAAGKTLSLRIYPWYTASSNTGKSLVTYNVQVTFTSTALGTSPTVTTTSAISTGTSTATGTGNISAIGTSNITASGFCWSTTSGSESISGNHSTDGPTGSTTGSFTSSITGLSGGQTYYVKAYATSNDGTGYGSELSFITPTAYYQSIASGDWSSTSTWQYSPDNISWSPATSVPDVGANSVIINQNHNITNSGTTATVGTVTINSGATLTNTGTTAITVASGQTLTIASGGVFDNQINSTTISAGSGSIQVNGTYKVTNTTGLSAVLAFTNVNFSSGSTLYIGGSGGPRIPTPIAGNLVWASTGGGTLVNSSTNTINGNLYITNGTPINNGTGGTGRSLTVNGDLYISAGQYNPLGLPGSGTTAQTATINGNVYLSGTGKLYAAQSKSGAGVGTLNIKGNVYIQNTSTDVALSGGAASIGTLSLNNTSLQTFNVDPSLTSSQYKVDSLTLSNTVGVSINNNLTVSNLTLAASSVTNVIASKQLTVSTSLTNNGTLKLFSNSTNGTATILTPATISGTTGTVKVQQYLSTARNWYMSSPVSGATSLPSVDNGSLIFYSYPENDPNQATGANGYAAGSVWNTVSSGSMALGTGYVVNASNAASTVTFTGTSLNTGDEPISGLTNTTANPMNGYNLIGNPYPSYLNVLPSIAANTNLDQTVWYRTQGTETPTPLYHFETVNATTGVGTNAAGTGQVTGYIPPMQSFWVHTNADAQSITLLNANRSHAGNITLNDGNSTVVPTTLLKSRALESNAQGMLRLNVSNGNTSDETVIYTNANASNGYDNYDSQKMSNNNAAIPEIYTTIGNEKLVINGMNSITPDTEIPLGFTTGQSNAFSIKATEFSNFDSDTKVYLKDNLLNTVQDMTDGTAYTFASDVASTTSRFSIVFKSVGMTTSVQAAANDPSVLIYKNANNQIAVNCNGSISDNAFVSVYNALGQKLESKQMTSSTTVINKSFTSGVYVVTVNNGGKSTTKKVILN